MKDVVLKNVILHIIAFLVMIALISVASGVLVEEGDYGNFSLDNVITVWDGTQAYWIIKDPYGTVISYWTFPQVQSYKAQGGGQWQYEVPINETANYSYYDSEGWRVKVLNYTLDSGSLLSIILEETPRKIKMSYGVYGAYKRNYRIDFTSNSVPSNKAYLDIIRKTFEWTDSVLYDFSDVTMEVSSYVHANKNFHQYISLGNAYKKWVWIDPEIIASDNPQYTSDGIVSSTSKVYVKVKEITVSDSYTGSWRIDFRMKCTSACSGAVKSYATIYKDGVPWGTERITNSSTYILYSEDFTSLNIANGTNIQLYVHNNGGTTWVSNFRINFDIIENTPPVYSNASHNNTIVGIPTLFSIQYEDETALEYNGQWVFSTNNSGIWVNDTPVNWTFSYSEHWANVTKTLTNNVGQTVGYRWFAFDNAGNWNNTPIYTLITTSPEPTPTPTPSNMNLTNPFNDSTTTYIYYRNGDMLVSILIYISTIQVFTVIIVTYNFMRRGLN